MFVAYHSLVISPIDSRQLCHDGSINLTLHSSIVAVDAIVLVGPVLTDASIGAWQ